MQPLPTDFFLSEAKHSQEARLVQSTTRQFVKEKFLPHILENYEKGHFPLEIATQLGALGLLGSQLQGYGCAGVDSLTYGLIMKELERGDSGLRSFASVQGALVMYPIHAFGSPEQKQRWLPLLAAGKAIGCFGLTEPDFGSNPAGMRTTARKSGSDYILHGSKTWITNAPVADLAVIWAQTEQGIRGFLVEKGTTGFQTPEIHHKLSLRASLTGSLVLDNVRVPQEALLPGTTGLKSALMCLSQARYGIAFGVLGAAEDALEEALSYTKERIVFEKPLASYQLVQAKLAHMSTQIALGNLMATRLAELKESGELHPAQISMAKQNNAKMALECARTARDVLGANGISLEYRCMRHACNLESVFTYEGTNDIHTLVVGQQLTGIAAFQ
jgi:glutaryl-CoA dehydrogenase